MADPIDFGIRKQMRVEVADRTVGLAQKFLAPQMAKLAYQAVHKNRKFLPHRGRRRLLAMSARNHRDVFEAPREPGEIANYPSEPRNQFTLGKFFQRKAVGEVVDIFGCAGEMH